MISRAQKLVAVLGVALFAGQLAAQETPSLPPIPIYPLLMRPADGSDLFGPTGSIFYSTAPGIGSTGDVTSVEGMIPFLQDPGRSLFFTDLRGLLSKERGVVGANLGGGYRFLDLDLERIFGVNVYYDNRDTGQVTFNQVAGGFESLGQFLDIRGNYYIPVGNRRRVVDDFFTDGGTSTTVVGTDPFFQGHNILFNELTTLTQVRNHFQATQSAMTGFELEVGTPVPFLERWVKGYAGVYNFQSSQSVQAWGVRGRLEARMNDALYLDLSVQNDRVFDTTVMFQVGVRFGGGAWRRRPDEELSDRLMEHVERNYSVVVRQQETVNPVVTTSTATSVVTAVDPTTGQPIIVDHVASFAAPGGNGTFEHPFQTLGQLQAGSNPGDILFAWANSTFANQSITLQANQRFLGEGTTHLFTSQFGTAVLPRATTNTNAPVITGGNGVTLANGTEVAGFTITNVANTAISGNNVTGVTIDRNTLTNNGNGDTSVIDLEYNATGQFTTFLTGNTLLNSSGTGIAVNATAGTVQATLIGNTVTGGSGDGISFNASGTSRMTLTLSGNTSSSNSGSGVSMFRASETGLTPDFSATLTGNTFANNGFEGISAFDLASTVSAASPMRVDLFNNNTSGNSGAGISLQSGGFLGGAANLLSHATGNTLTGDNVAGIDGGGFQAQTFSAVGGVSSLALFLGNNTSTPASGSGFNLQNSAGNSFLFQNAGGNTGSFSTTGTITNGTVPP